MKSILAVVGIFFMLTTQRVWCQEVKTTRDIGVWTGVGAKFKVRKKLKGSIAQEFRSFDNSTKLDRSITDFGLAYTINKQFKLEGGARYGYARNSDLTYIHNIRYNVDFKFKIKPVKHLALIYRFRFQNNYTNLFQRFPETVQRRNMRNRIKAEYKIEQHTVFFAAEIFRRHVFYKRPHFNNLRLSLGDQIDTKFGRFNYAVACNYELNEEYPLHFYFLKLNYFIDL